MAKNRNKRKRTLAEELRAMKGKGTPNVSPDVLLGQGGGTYGGGDHEVRPPRKPPTQSPDVTLGNAGRGYGGSNIPPSPNSTPSSSNVSDRPQNVVGRNTHTPSVAAVQLEPAARRELLGSGIATGLQEGLEAIVGERVARQASLKRGVPTGDEITGKMIRKAVPKIVPKLTEDDTQGTDVLSARARAIWDEALSRGGNPSQAEAVVKRWWQQAKGASGLKGPLPKVQFGKNLDVAAQVVTRNNGKPKIQFSQPPAEFAGPVAKALGMNPSVREIALHEFAHVGTARAGKDYIPARDEGRADRFSKLVTEKQGREFTGFGEAYASYRKLSRHRDSRKKILGGQFVGQGRGGRGGPAKSGANVGAPSLSGSEKALFYGDGKLPPVPSTVPARNNTERPPGQAGRGTPTKAQAEAHFHETQQHTLRKLAKKYPEIAHAIPDIVGAAKRQGVDASVLASIYGVETGHGTNVAVSSAGAQGPMQFMPATFDAYGIDSPRDKDKVADIQSTSDAIESAANYLSASGYKDDPQAAIFAYNHADWYVDDVIQGAKKYAALDRVPKGQGGQLLEPPPKKTVTRFQAIVDEAKKIDSAQVPYVYGGGHVAGKVPGPGKTTYDCSSSVSRVLQAAGLPLPGALVSGDLATTPLLKDGPGAVTIYANPGHVFMKIGNRFWGTSKTNPQGGPGFIEGGYDQSYLDQYTVRHVPGMGQEIARRMGVRLTPGGTAAGATNSGLVLSNNGTTATITDGAYQGKPGPSKKPIRADVAVTPIRSPLAARYALPEGSVAASLDAQEAGGEGELFGSQAAYIPRRRRR